MVLFILATTTDGAPSEWARKMYGETVPMFRGNHLSNTVFFKSGE